VGGEGCEDGCCNGGLHDVDLRSLAFRVIWQMLDSAATADEKGLQFWEGRRKVLCGNVYKLNGSEMRAKEHPKRTADGNPRDIVVMIGAGCLACKRLVFGGHLLALLCL
jgi:hypothetical protein